MIEQLNICIFHRSPQAFVEDVVKGAPSRIHTDPRPGRFEPSGEGPTGKLTALIALEYFVATMLKRLFKGLPTEVGVRGIRRHPC